MPANSSKSKTKSKNSKNSSNKSNTAKQREPWEKPAPKKSRHTKLSPASKAAAKRSAKKAGRKYPSLVDNMNAAKKQRARSSKSK